MKIVVRNKSTNTNMKTLNTLLLTGAVALGFTLTTAAKGDEPVLSPKAAALRHDLRSAQSAGSSPNLVSGNYLGSAAKTEFNRVKVEQGATVTPSLVSGNYLGAGAKNPYQRTASFEIAPLVGKDKSGKICEAGCATPGCAKK